MTPRSSVPRRRHPVIVPDCYPGLTRAGPVGCGCAAPWSCPDSAVVVPSGFRTSVQPHRWITTWWWNQHNRTQSRTLVLPPFFLCLTWCTWHAAGGLVALAGPLAVLVPQDDRVADRGRDGLAEADVQRQARPAQPGAELPAPQEGRQAARTGEQVDGFADDGLLQGLPGRAVLARVGVAAGRCRPPGGGAGPVRRRAGPGHPGRRGSPRRSRSGPSPRRRRWPRRRRRPATRRRRCRRREAAARCAAHCARTRAVHSSCSAELPSSTHQVRQRDVRPRLHRLPGPLGQQPGRDQPAMRPLCFCVMMDSWTTHRQTGRKPSSGRACTAV